MESTQAEELKDQNYSLPEEQCTDTTVLCHMVAPICEKADYFTFQHNKSLNLSKLTHPATIQDLINRRIIKAKKVKVCLIRSSPRRNTSNPCNLVLQRNYRATEVSGSTSLSVQQANLMIYTIYIQIVGKSLTISEQS